MEIPVLTAGDILTMKKAHPCGSFKFEILRVGSDIRIKCLKCGHSLEISREKLEKRIKSISHTDQ